MRIPAAAATVAALATVIPGAALAPAPPAAAQDYPCAIPAPTPTPAAPAGAGEVRRFATGAGVRVAVIDTGVSPNAELSRLVPGADFVTPDAPNPLFDCDGHGTVVAGIIGAASSGIAPDSEILAVRQTSSHYRNRRGGDTVETSGSVRSLAEAIHAALDERARVLNISVVSCVDPRDVGALDATVLHAALNRAEQEGAVVVAAAGNVSENCAQGSFVLPSHFPTVLAVGARESAHELAGYSVSSPAESPPLSAPGAPGPGLSWSGDGFARGSAIDRDTVTPFVGTSFAAPVVAGTVALLLERHPHLSPARVRDVVAAAAQPSGGAVTPLAVVTHLAAEAPAAPAGSTPLVVEPAEVVASPAPARGAFAGSVALLAALAAGCAAALVSRWRSGQTPG
ncbi:S8 family serine peptidase [Corynebacterium sp. UBA2622]|uniref:S8 family serine peptidase n=1 Tax=Corynebacterium sp. UBA2622 TaxID=1946393 RepID=UPI0025BD6E15|nr:S8 family serine peptidase [Corynebacterium sp. UBA2622]